MESTFNTAVSAQRSDVYIRLRFKSDRRLEIARSFLMESSSYFSAMLSETSAWKESQTGVIELPTWRRQKFLKVMRCLETGDLEPVLTEMKKFFGVIHYFSIEPLMEKCVETRSANISDESVVEDFMFAKQYSIMRLRNECISYLLNHLPKCLQNDERNRMMPKDLLQAVLDHERLAVPDESTVLSCINMWCTLEGRQSHRAELLRSLRFAHLTVRDFSKCQEDRDCWEVPQFRALVESSCWGELGENLLSGRAYSRGHVHAIGRLVSGGSGTFTGTESYIDEVGKFRHYCSRSGITKLPECAKSRTRFSAITNPVQTIVVGNELFMCHGPTHPVRVSDQIWAVAVEEFRQYQGSRSREPECYLRFPGPIFFAAPPAVDAGDVCIAHVIYNGPSIVSRNVWDSKDAQVSQFGEVEFIRYHNGTRYGNANRVKVDLETFSWTETCFSLLTETSNKLCVRGDWAMLLVPDLGVLVALDKKPDCGAIIYLPMKTVKAHTRLFSSVQCSSSLAISGDVAYVILTHNFRFLDIDEDGEFVESRNPMAYLITIDLVTGELVNDLDVGAAVAKKKLVEGEEYELFLKVVQNDVFLHGMSTHVMRKEDDVMTPSSFVFRVETSAGKLSMTPLESDIDSYGNESREESIENGFRWIGAPIPVGALLCEHATMIHLKASEEEDTENSEKLRQYTW